MPLRPATRPRGSRGLLSTARCLSPHASFARHILEQNRSCRLDEIRTARSSKIASGDTKSGRARRARIPRFDGVDKVSSEFGRSRVVDPCDAEALAAPYGYAPIPATPASPGAPGRRSKAFAPSFTASRAWASSSLIPLALRLNWLCCKPALCSGPRRRSIEAL